MITRNKLMKILFLLTFNPTGRTDPFEEIYNSQTKISLQFADYSLLGVIYIIHGRVNHFTGFVIYSLVKMRMFFSFRVNCCGTVKLVYECSLQYYKLTKVVCSRFLIDCQFKIQFMWS